MRSVALCNRYAGLFNLEPLTLDQRILYFIYFINKKRYIEQRVAQIDIKTKYLAQFGRDEEHNYPMCIKSVKGSSI